MKPTKQERVFYYTANRAKDDEGLLSNDHYTAKIIFAKSNLEGADDVWRFEKCQFDGASKQYIEQDFGFMSKIYVEITRLKNELNK